MITGSVGPSELAVKLGWSPSDPRIPSLLKRLVAAMNWLGMNDPHEVVDHTASSYLDAFCSLLQEKLVYSASERDMVAMHHEFKILWADGSKEFKTSTMVSYGTPGGYSAMAKTVGFPAAITTKLLLEGVTMPKGVVAPMDKMVYEPILQALEAEGIKFTETSKML